MYRKFRNQKFIIFIFTSIIIFNLSTTLFASSEEDWSYSGSNGPKNWGNLDPSYVMCEKGSRQSPINIDTSKVLQTSRLQGTYFLYKRTPLSLENNGHMINIIPEKKRSTLWIGTDLYFLKQIHFHHPSEHERNNEKYPMEIHFVHENKKGKLAVASIFVREGLSNNAEKTIFKSIPKKLGEVKKIETDVLLSSLLPKNKNVYRYDGSLTTPPCTEDVSWLVFTEPIELSHEHISSFAKIYSGNNRPLQPINERDVYIKMK